MPRTMKSREKVWCGFPGCELKCQERLINRHFKRIHPKHKPTIRRTDTWFGPGGRWSSWVQPRPTLGAQQQNEAVTGSQRDVNVPESNANEVEMAEPGEAVVPASGDEDDPSPAPHQVDSAACDTAVASSGGEALGGEHCSSSAAPHQVESAPSDGATSAHSQLLRIAEDVSAIKRSTNLLLAQRAPGPQSGTDGGASCAGMPPAPQAVDLISSVRSIHALELLTDHELTAYPDEQAVVCTTCVPDFDPELHMGQRVTGVFGYEYSAGTSFEKNDRLPAAFCRLKATIKDHLKGREHARAKEDQRNAAEEAERYFATAKVVSMRLGRTAYVVLKTSMARARYEELVFLQHINGLDMGRIRHSGSQIAGYRTATHEVLVKELSQHVAAQPCVALMADKVTVNHRTIDITALMSVVPHAPAGQLIQTYVIGAPVVIRHDGKSMVEQWLDTVKAVGVNSTEQLSAVCTDGQYLHNHVPETFLRKLGSASGRAAVPCLWDGAHLMQLAEGSARNEDSAAWVRDVIEDVTRITNRFKRGGGLEQLRAEATRRGARMRSPQLWSETRFAPYAATVLEAFQTNLLLMEAVLERQLQFCQADCVSKLNADIRVLRAKPFRLRLAALIDIYGVLSNLSKSEQDTQKLPWERQESLTSAAGSMVEMARGLSDKVAAPSSVRRQPQLDSAGIRRQLEATTGAEFAELWPKLGKLLERATLLPQQAEEIVVFCRTLADHCRRRSHGVDNRGNNHGCDNAKLANNMEDVRMVGDLVQLRAARFAYTTIDVSKASERLTRSGLIPAACPLESIRAVYDELRSDKCKAMCTNQELLKHLLLLKAPMMKPYLDLVVRVWLSSPPESVVESMASAVKEVFGVHRQLSHANAAMELVIRWNGPDLGAADQLVAAVVKLRKSDGGASSSASLLTGKVLRRHFDKVCARSRAFFSGVSQKAVRYIQKRQ